MATGYRGNPRFRPNEAAKEGGDPTKPPVPDPSDPNNNPNLPGQQYPPPTTGPQSLPAPQPSWDSGWPPGVPPPNPPTPYLPLFQQSDYPSVSPFAVSAPTVSGTSYDPALISPTSYQAEGVSPTTYDPSLISSVPQAPLFTLGPSQFEHLNVDPTGRNAQLQMLSEMQKAYSEGGLDDISRAQIEQVLLSERTAATAASAGAYQEAERRGLGTSANALAASLFASQQATQTAAQQALQVGSLAEQRRNQLRTDISGLGGNIFSQNYKMAADRASAVDAINQFNVSNKQQYTEAAATREMQATTANQGAQNQALQFNAGQIQGAQQFTAGAENTAANANATRAQEAAASNAAERNTASRFSAQTAFEAANQNAQRELEASQFNSGQSFASEEYNSGRTWQIANANKNVDQFNQQAKDQDYWNTWNATDQNYWNTLGNYGNDKRFNPPPPPPPGG